MPEPTTKVRCGIQTAYPGGQTVPRVRFTVPELNWSESGHHSVVAEFTGTSLHTIAIGSGPEISVDAVTQKDPITKATLLPANITGIAIHAKRAVAATAPTGNVSLAFVADFAGVTTSNPFELGDGAFFLFHRNRGAVAVDGESMTINLTGTTGYKVSVLVYFEED